MEVKSSLEGCSLFFNSSTMVFNDSELGYQFSLDTNGSPMSLVPNQIINPRLRWRFLLLANSDR